MGALYNHMPMHSFLQCLQEAILMRMVWTKPCMGTKLKVVKGCEDEVASELQDRLPTYWLSLKEHSRQSESFRKPTGCSMNISRVFGLSVIVILWKIYQTSTSLHYWCAYRLTAPTLHVEVGLPLHSGIQMDQHYPIYPFPFQMWILGGV